MVAIFDLGLELNGWSLSSQAINKSLDASNIRRLLLVGVFILIVISSFIPRSYFQRAAAKVSLPMMRTFTVAVTDNENRRESYVT